jgi:hypothetical protein
LISPCLCWCMRSVGIGYGHLSTHTSPFEHCRDQLRRQSPSQCHLPNVICAFCSVGYSNDIISPTFLSVLPEITCRFGIPFIEESSHRAFPALAGFGNATKGMTTTPLDVLDLRDRLKKGIDR